MYICKPAQPIHTHTSVTKGEASVVHAFFKLRGEWEGNCFQREGPRLNLPPTPVSK